jgi:hypothetical protein
MSFLDVLRADGREKYITGEIVLHIARRQRPMGDGTVLLSKAISH